MGYLTTLLTGTPGPASDFWYKPAGEFTLNGMTLDASGAQKLSAFHRGVDLLSTSLAMLPCPVYERLPNDRGRRPARDLREFTLLGRQPNPWQNTFEWRRQAMRHLILHGNAYDYIVPGRTALIPIDPTKVTPRLVEGSYRLAFDVRSKTGEMQTFTQDEIFHLHGPSDDGVNGLSVLKFAKQSLGIHLAVESYAGRLFTQGSLNGGTISVPGLLNDDASKRMAQSFTTSASQWHLPRVLEQGATWAESQMSAEDAQMLLSRKFTVTDVARWLGIQPHMLADLDRSTNNNIEEQGQEFVTYSLGMWLALFEAAFNTQLIDDPDTYYAEFNRNALERGNMATRWAAYVAGVTGGILAPNEPRAWENLNKLDGLDVPYEPRNITGNTNPGAPSQQPKRQAPADPPADPARRRATVLDRARAIATESSARLLRKEQAAMLKAAVDDPIGAEWVTRVTAFYDKHAALVAASMQIGADLAGAYCTTQRDDLIEGGVAVMETWTPGYLAGLALDVPPAPQPISIAVQSTVEKGAVEIASPVTVTTPAVSVPVTIGAPQTTIERGAVQVMAGAIKSETTVSVPQGPAKTVTKVITRDPATREIVGVTETTKE